MLTLEKIIKSSNCIKNKKLVKSFGKITDLTIELSEKFDHLGMVGIIDMLDLISKEAYAVGEIFKIMEIQVEDKFLIKAEVKEYFEDIQKNIKNKFGNMDLSLQFNLAEAVEVLYGNLEIVQNFRINESDNNEIYLLNLIYELYLNIEQQYLYNYSELRKHSLFH